MRLALLLSAAMGIACLVTCSAASDTGKISTAVGRVKDGGAAVKLGRFLREHKNHDPSDEEERGFTLSNFVKAADASREAKDMKNIIQMADDILKKPSKANLAYAVWHGKQYTRTQIQEALAAKKYHSVYNGYSFHLDQLDGA